MSTLLPETVEPVTPAEEEARLARELSRRLAAHLGERGDVQVQILDALRPAGETWTLPESALQFFSHILTEMAKGHAVTLMPTHAELTTDQAADLLNVSSPFLIGLLEQGRIPYRTVGKLRRVRFTDLMDYKKKSDDLRLQALDELTALTEEMGLY